MFGLEMRELLMVGGGAVLALAVLLVFLKSLFTGGKKKKGANSQASLAEHLEEYPDAPPARAGRRLLVDGLEARLRLVVMAPAGTQQRPLTPDDVADVLDDFMRGLGAFVQADKPRVRVWPAQLSAKGFAPTFFRLVESPDPKDEESNWVRLAGPIKAAGKPYLLGLALWAEEASKIHAIDLSPNQWSEHLRVEK